ncbi:NAD(P)/FAD-dependent oxidoreductase [Paenibacillus sp. OV219]|uniref:NAD(P)/FAD-dependent oxidoreductase n=1 Tax=Paenibacillus sp. OV219 TaxID=1884377 RepID=UPI0008D83809|nr:FAD-dependent oxidoreductase [Paenibacillus sp. OV219]SEN80870.1 Thioredoxin reductase [Paenibacillus sp. OV219]
MDEWQLLIIGAGISGLTAAIEAHNKGYEQVLLIDYQKEIGGFTRFYMDSSDFEKERKLLDRARNLPYPIWTQSTAIGLFANNKDKSNKVIVQTPNQNLTLKARKVLIASGALEKPREAHRIAGDRPAGVMTPIMAAQLLERGFKPGERIIQFNSGRIAMSLAQMLRSRNCQLTMLDEQQYDVIHIKGSSRVEGIVVRNRVTGTEEFLHCDTLIYNEGRLPGTFFLKGGVIERDSAMAVKIDQYGRTNITGVFAAGSCTTVGDDNHLNSIELAQQVMEKLLI